MGKTGILLASVGLLVLLTSGTVLAQATTHREVTTEPVEGMIRSHCSGERIQFSGELHIVRQYTIDANGGHHVHQTSNLQNISAIGLNGNKYRLVSQRVHEQFVGPLPSQETTQTITLFVSQGPSDNFLAHVLLHFTINANGEVTTEVGDRHDGKCVG